MQLRCQITTSRKGAVDTQELIMQAFCGRSPYGTVRMYQPEEEKTNQTNFNVEEQYAEQSWVQVNGFWRRKGRNGRTTEIGKGVR